jgi:positive regulator of sigma E activity
MGRKQFFCHNKHVAIKIIIIYASPLVTWYIFRVIVDYNSFGVDNLCFEGITCVLVVKWCIIFNHSLKLRKETNNPSFLKNLMKDMI